MESNLGSYLIIRADANARIGSGHLMRCLALAQAWKLKGGSVVFVTDCDSEALRGRLKNEGFTVIEIENPFPDELDLKTTLDVLRKHPQAWCIVDGYNFDSEFHGAIRRENSLLTIDDTAHLPFYDADAILNQNINAEELNYRTKDARLFLGTRYALLRNEFLAWQKLNRQNPETARKILITMGGGDSHNQTLKALRAISRLKIRNLDIKAVIGASNPHFEALRNEAANSPAEIELIKSAENMAELMAWADACVSAAGSTCWELAFMKLPSVLLILADNQIGLAEGLGKAGFAENAGWFEGVSENDLAEKLEAILISSARRNQMSAMGRRIVDGRGAARIVESLQEKA